MFYPVDFEPQSMEASDPIGYGLRQAFANRIAALQSQAMPQMLQQEMQKNALANALSQINLQTAPQMNRALLATEQARPGLMNAQASEAGAQAGYLGTETARNNFLLKNPGLMLTGPAGDIAGLTYLAKTNPGMFGQSGGASPGMSGQGGGMPGTPGGGMNPSSPGMSGGLGAAIRAAYDPIFRMQMEAAGKGLDAQATTNVDQYNKNLTQAAQDATQANAMINQINQFKDAYNNSKYVGPQLGSVPSKGLFSPLFSDLTNEQNADNAAQNMQVNMAKMINANRITNAQLKLAGGLKLNRNLTPDAVDNLSNLFSGLASRSIEKQNFLIAARNQGIDPNTANAQWQKYNSENPVYDFDKKQINSYGQNAWAPYLNPSNSQSNLASAVSNKQQSPMPKFNSKADFQAWYKAQPPQVQAAVRAHLGGQ